MGDIVSRILGDGNLATILLEERAALLEAVQTWNDAWAAYSDDE
jgi:hypothetical protein